MTSTLFAQRRIKALGVRRVGAYAYPVQKSVGHTSPAPGRFEELMGQSPALQVVLDKVRSVAPTDASMLITG